MTDDAFPIYYLFHTHFKGSPMSYNSTNTWAADRSRKTHFSLFAIFIFCSLLHTFASGNSLIDTNTVALFHCDEGSGTTMYDSSGNGNNGTIYNAAWVNGISGKGLDFQNGSSAYAEIANSQNFTYNEMTIEMWVNLASFPSPVSYLFSKGNDRGNSAYPGDGSILLYFGGGNHISFGISSATQASGFGISSKTIFATGKWYHIAVSYKIGGAAYIYINGALDTSIVASTVLVSNTYKCQLGKGEWVPNFPYFLNGTMDEIRISKVQRSAAEILSDYNKFDTNAVALFHCDEGSGTTMYDSSGNGNNGTIYNATWVNGISGKGLDFQNTNHAYAEIANSQNFTYNEMTIEMWVNPASFSYQYLFSKGNDGGNAAYPSAGSILLIINSGKINFFKTNSVNLSSKTTLIAGNWYHIAATYKTGGTAAIYINAVLDSTGVASTDLSSNNYKCQLGKINGDPNYPYYLNGTMDEIRVSNVQRSGAEILSDYRKYNQSFVIKTPATFQSSSFRVTGSQKELRYAIPVRCRVSISMYNLQGKLEGAF